MTPERREQLGMLASGIAQHLAFLVPLCDEAMFVGRRIMAMVLGNSVDLMDMQSKGLTIDQALDGELAKLREETRGIVEYRLLHEHEPNGGAKH